MRLETLGNVAKIANGFAFSEQYQGHESYPIPFIKVSDFVLAKDNWLSSAANTVNNTLLGKIGAKVYPAGTIIFPKVGGALLTNKRARLGIDATFDNNIMGLIPEKIDGEYLFYFMLGYDLSSIANTQSIPSVRASDVANIKIPFPVLSKQRHFVSQIKSQLSEVEKARKAVELQLREVESLGNAIVFDSIRKGKTKTALIGEVLDEVKKGVGENWHEHLVLGATRNGLALAKEPPGKNPQRYKPVVPGTIFYNPMRIMIGSIAMVDDGDIQGITSPDYVVLKGGEGKVDSRWFYYWLRSPLGKHCINTLARGAVRERMLFNRLADGEIELPDYKIQLKASESLKQLRQLKSTFTQGLKELELIPDKLLKQVFDGFASNN